MTPRRDPLAELVRETLCQPAAEREAWVRQRCAHESALAETILRLAREQEQRTLVDSTQFAAMPSVSAAAAPSAGMIPVPGHGVPDRFGPFRVLDVLGEGGMGMVYLAEQERPRRTVALKVIRPGLLTPKLLRRFELEAQTLARLQHPGISQIYDAGTFKDPATGEQPYFAMEYVRGQPLNEYAQTHRLGVPERLRLFIRVCEAVQHAHQRGVIHRDLKSANILVTPEGDPKILDFGVAKLTDQALDTSHPAHTAAGQVVGTVPYMSPEQIGGQPTEVDTRSDVYTMGVILYELLSGQLPHAVHGRTLVEASHIIASQNAQRLGSFSGEFRGDLETIAAKAVERDKAQRYQSPAELASDLERYLNDEPIVARPPSRVYLIRKFAQRNRALVALGAAAAGILLAGVAGVSWQAIEATRGRNLAERMRLTAEAAKGQAIREANIARQINQLLANMLTTANPDESLGREVTVKDIVDRTALDLDTMVSDPRVLASLHGTLSGIYQNLGKLPAAEHHARRALEIQTREYGPNHQESWAAQRQLANTLTDQSRFLESLPILQQVVDGLSAGRGVRAPETIAARLDLARVLRESGRMDDADRELTSVRRDALAELGGRHETTLYAMHNTASLRKDQGRFDEAIAMFRELIEIRIEQNGPQHTQTLSAMNNLAATLQRAGKNQEALAMLDRLYEARCATLGADHPSTLTTLANRGVALVAMKRFEEAEPLLRQTVDGYTRIAGESHNKTLVAMGNLAFALEDLGRDGEAEQLYRRIIDMRSRLAGPSDVEMLSTTNNLAMLVQRQGRSEEAAAMFEVLVRRCDKAFPPGHYAAAAFKNNYGACLTELGRLGEAEPLLVKSLEDLARTFPPEHPRVVKARLRLEALRTKLSQLNPPPAPPN